MHRLCLLIPDISTMKRISEHIQTNGVSNRHIHVLGKSSLAIEHLHLHPANLLQTTNLPQILLKGGMLGLIFGMFTGGSLFILSPWGLSMPLSSIMIFMLVGMILGLWISGLIGIGVQNGIVEQARPFIQEGKYLMMIDLNRDQEKNLEGEILKRFPQIISKTDILH